MKLRFTLLMAAAAGLGGCAGAGAPVPGPLPAAHPASPDAAAAPERARSGTLAIAPAEDRQDPLRDAGPTRPEHPESSAAAGGHGEHHRHGAPPAATGAIYACPMHPEVTSSDPDDPCPRCGMRLTEAAAPEER